MKKKNQTQFIVGTSGYSYKEWKGSFYPEKFSNKDMLRYYGERFSTVEINNTFYAMPKTEVLKSWADQVPEKFQFVLKAPQLITHFRRLNNVKDEVKEFQKTSGVLKGRLGPLLFQLPPNFKKDVARLSAFLKLIGNNVRVAMEFRHESWFDEEIFDVLRKKSCALCAADADDGLAPCVAKTADWGYARLRREVYNKKDLTKWADSFKAQKWNEAFIFFKHEDSGTAPKYANKFVEVVDSL